MIRKNCFAPAISCRTTYAAARGLIVAKECMKPNQVTLSARSSSQDHKIYFPQSGVKLPVRLRSGDVSWITWGKRKEENDSRFPNGGWVRLDSIKLGKWKPWHPR